ncbi:acyl-CoA dehydrogenase family protein [Nocardiopsis sp. LOL_012]|uniref:acyl-CoA dehydrogenase family protein n=1 Tax=Nocardiopsis sp. LOL_012 TaxID=3345409 RepID=UPI003A8B2068
MFITVGLAPDLEEERAELATFVHDRISPFADAWDRAERVPREFVSELAERGYLGAAVPGEYGGGSLDAASFGLLNEELGRGCSSVRSLLTVHSMVAQAVSRWGRPEQKEYWLPRFASGESIGAFALTEPGAGSDVQGIAAQARRTGTGFVLDGVKRWITFGQIADVFLLFAEVEEAKAAFLVPADTPGLTVRPISGVLGTRASMLAELHLDGCALPADAMVGRPGFGLSAVAATALELGRYSVAWGCVGLAQACLDASLAYADEREQFGRRLRDHQLVQRLITDMATGTSAARLLCQQAGALRDARDVRSVHATWMAKYFSSTSAFRAASDAVQILGASGCGGEHPVQRYLRDAKVMEIIEGTTQLQQTVIAESVYHHRTPVRREEQQTKTMTGARR